MYFNSTIVKSIVLSFLSFLAISYTSFPCKAQVPSAHPQQTEQQKEEAQKAQKELEKKAIALLDELIAESTSSTLAENRIFVLMKASEMLWSHDEARARKFLGEAKDQIITLNAQLTQGKESMALRQHHQLSATIQSLRTQILGWLGSRDSDLALDFLRATRPQFTDGQQSGFDFDDRDLEAQLASQIAMNNPQLAYQMAEELLKKDLTEQVVDIWSNLRRKDPELGWKLADGIVAKLKSGDLLVNENYVYPAIQMLQQMKAAMNESARSQSERKGSSSLSRESIDGKKAYRELLDLLVGTALRVHPDVLKALGDAALGPGHQLLTTMNTFLPDIESYLPSRVAAFRGKLAQFEKALQNTPLQAYGEFERKMQEMEDKPAKEILNMASSSPPEMKEMIYLHALSKAMEEGDKETARNIVKEYGPSHPNLNQIFNQLESGLAVESANEGKYDEARRVLAQLSSDEEKATILARSATGALSNKDEKTARKFLEEARGIIGDKMRTQRQIYAQIAIAGGYRNLDPNRTFETMGVIIERLDKVFAAAKEYFVFSEMSEDELSMVSGPMGSIISGQLSPIASELAQLARKDFERTTGLLRRGQVNETRVMISLYVLLNLLGGQSEMQNFAFDASAQEAQFFLPFGALPPPPPYSRVFRAIRKQ